MQRCCPYHSPSNRATTTTLLRIITNTSRSHPGNNNRSNNLLLCVSSRCSSSSSSISDDDGDDATTQPRMVRLSKRMSELDLCSRREADRLISKRRVWVNGAPIRDTLGQKVPWNETDIRIVNNNQQQQPAAAEFAAEAPAAVVLNKPAGCVSGQPEDGHTPAVRLLTLENRVAAATDPSPPSWWNPNHKTLHGYAPAGRLDRDSTGLLVFCRSGVLAKKLIQNSNSNKRQTRTNTKKNKNSKITEQQQEERSIMDKEYVVTVEPAQQATKHERRAGLYELPRPPVRDLRVLLRGGAVLAGESDRPLLPLPEAQWINRDSDEYYFYNHHADDYDEHSLQLRKLRLVLQEGRKHQIKRMCRELLGYHVVRLQRIRIGPIHLYRSANDDDYDDNDDEDRFHDQYHDAMFSSIDDDDDNGDDANNNADMADPLLLPEGKWRPITQQEMDSLLSDY